MNNLLMTIQDIIFNATGRKDVVLDTDFMKDLKLNSFDIINIIAGIEAKFNISVPIKDLWKMHTVRDFVNYMSEKGV